MNRINSVYQNPINTNYKYSVNNTSPSFNGNYRFAEKTVNTAVRNKGNILKGVTGFLGSIGLLNIAKDICKKTQEEVKITEIKPISEEPVQVQEEIIEPQIQAQAPQIQAQEPPKQVQEVQIQVIAPVKYTTWEDLFNKIEEVANAEYDNAVAEANNQFEEAKKTAEEQQDSVIKAAETEYQKEYDDLCLDTIGRKCEDLELEAHHEYKAIYGHGMLAKAHDEYISLYGHGILEKAYDEYKAQYGHSMIAKAFDNYINNRITKEEYEKITAKAEAEYEAIKKDSQIKYQEIKAKADEKYNDTIARLKALKQKRDEKINTINATIESAKTERDNSIKEAKEKRDNILAECKKFHEVNTGIMDVPMTEKEALKAAKIKLKKVEKAQAIEKAEREKKIAEKAAKAKEMAAELEKSGFINIKELSNGSLQFEYQGVRYKISNNKGQNTNLYKSLLRGVQDGSLTKDTSIMALSGNQSYDCDWLFDSQQASVKSILKFVSSSNIAQENPYFADKLEKALNGLANEEIDAYIDEYKSAVLVTQKGKKYVEELKTSNPQRYIEIITPKALFKTNEGREYLKEKNPAIYIEIMTPAKLYTTKEGREYLKENAFDTYIDLEAIAEIRRQSRHKQIGEIHRPSEEKEEEIMRKLEERRNATKTVEQQKAEEEERMRKLEEELKAQRALIHKLAKVEGHDERYAEYDGDFEIVKQKTEAYTMEYQNHDFGTRYITFYYNKNGRIVKQEAKFVPNT